MLVVFIVVPGLVLASKEWEGYKGKTYRADPNYFPGFVGERVEAPLAIIKNGSGGYEK